MIVRSEEVMAHTPPPSIARLSLIELLLTVRVLCWRKAPPPYGALFSFTDAPSDNMIVDNEDALTPPPVLPPVFKCISLLEAVSLLLCRNAPPPKVLAMLLEMEEFIALTLLVVK